MEQGSDAYDCAYADAMDRIEGLAASHKMLAKNALLWIAFARRPLMMEELRHALAVYPGDSALNEDKLPNDKQILSVCAGLVTVDENSGIIRLVHSTAQEYLKRTQEKWFPGADARIASICVTYLSFSTFESGFCQTDEDFSERLREYHLYDYAACNWGDHVRNSSCLGQDVRSFLSKKPQVEASSQALMASRASFLMPGYSQDVPRQVTAMHLAAYFGIGNAVAELLSGGQTADPKDSYERTPLFWAAKGGHGGVTEILVRVGKADPTLKDREGHTPVSLAAWSGFDPVVEVLLEAAVDFDSVRVALLGAMMNGHESTMRLILGSARPDTKATLYSTALSQAVRASRSSAVEFLLNESVADRDCKDGFIGAPLLDAVKWGHEAITKLLLGSSKIDPNWRDACGGTALSQAAEFGREAIVVLLLSREKTDPDRRNAHGQTPMSLAARYGHAGIVRVLASLKRVDAGSVDEYDRTPLIYAAREGHEAVVEFLMESGKLNGAAHDAEKQEALSEAKKNGHDKVVRLLQGHGVAEDSVCRGEDLSSPLGLNSGTGSSSDCGTDSDVESSNLGD